MSDLFLRQGTRVTVPSSGYAVTTATARNQLQLESGDTSKDTELARFIAAAHAYVEGRLGYPILDQTRATHLTGFPDAGRPIWIGAGADLAVTSVQYYDTTGAQQTLSGSNYILDSVSLPARLTLAPTLTDWPETQDRPGAVIITWTAGWADDTEVPADIAQAVLLLVGHWDLNREAAGRVEGALVFAVDALLDNHIVWAL